MPIKINPDLFPPGILSQYVGKGDNVASGEIDAGTLFAMQRSSIGTEQIEAQFIEPWYLAAGGMTWANAVAGDYVKFEFFCPASPVTSTPGVGNCDKVAISATTNVLVPNISNTGNWTIDLSAKLNSNVDFTAVVPVPADNSQGHYDWNIETNIVSINASGKGKYYLLDNEQSLHHFVRTVPILGSNTQFLAVSAIKTFLCLPHWKIRISLYNSTTKDLSLTAMLYRGI